MPVVVVANPKGGVGKSTLATNIAGWWASRGHAVMLGDADRQQSSRLWLDLRPPGLPAIRGWEFPADDEPVRPPKGTTHVVLDTPAGLHGKAMRELLRHADKVVVPLGPSLFDMYATRDFLAELAERRRTAGLSIGLVGMRVDARTLAADQLQAFVQTLDLALVAQLRPTQNYLHLAAHGLSLFDVPPAKVARDLVQWEPLCHWLDT